jgi:hypothetical protein
MFWAMCKWIKPYSIWNQTHFRFLFLKPKISSLEMRKTENETKLKVFSKKKNP